MATANVNVAGLKGDINGDGVVDIADAVGVVDIILNNGAISAPQLDIQEPEVESE